MANSPASHGPKAAITGRAQFAKGLSGPQDRNSFQAARTPPLASGKPWRKATATPVKWALGICTRQPLPAIHGTDHLAFDAPGDVPVTVAAGATRQVGVPKNRLSQPARRPKGNLRHGMSAGSGWELTAQYMGYQSGRLFPTQLAPADLNGGMRALHRNFVFNEACPAPSGFAGKLSMGIGYQCLRNLATARQLTARNRASPVASAFLTKSLYFASS